MADQENFVEVVQCPVCLQVPFEEIYLCQNGHHICKDCIPKVYRKCPQCRIWLGKGQNGSGVRNVGMEALIALAKFDCPNDCGKKEIKGSEMKDHLESHCSTREIVCLYCPDIDGISKRKMVKMPMPTKDFISHMLEAHGAKGTGYPSQKETFKRRYTLDSLMNVGRDQLIPNFLFFDKRYFFINLRREVHTDVLNMMYIWVSVLGGKSTAEMYNVELSLRGQVGGTVTYTLPVLEVRNDHERPAISDAATFTWDQLGAFSKRCDFFTCVENSKTNCLSLFEFDIQVTILFAKPEAGDGDGQE